MKVSSGNRAVAWRVDPQTERRTGMATLNFRVHAKAPSEYQRQWFRRCEQDPSLSEQEPVRGSYKYREDISGLSKKREILDYISNL